ncbi:hypothetical protein [Corynebacterium aquilae]|uniref:Uncharacterized protein n=1 Tax=Corynebacterium aquilae DSM 44791 TaxID=1431546 RepID=A0A1L7CHC4_9CORY|nr:hypothetical protein [Corynebacterium aquilae]APT85248.1 hypothetical protein CAQU_09385 [Corynebacterium aquilae DSM 44791]
MSEDSTLPPTKQQALTQLAAVDAINHEVKAVTELSWPIRIFFGAFFGLYIATAIIFGANWFAVAFLLILLLGVAFFYLRSRKIGVRASSRTEFGTAAPKPSTRTTVSLIVLYAMTIAPTLFVNDIHQGLSGTTRTIVGATVGLVYFVATTLLISDDTFYPRGTATKHAPGQEK